MNNFYIVNDVDRPEQRHVTILRDGKLHYVHPELSKWGGMSMRDESTSMQDFGFTVTEAGGFVTFVLNNECVAKYRDGTSRKWQGCTNFTIDINSFGDKNAK